MRNWWDQKSSFLVRMKSFLALYLTCILAMLSSSASLVSLFRYSHFIIIIVYILIHRSHLCLFLTWIKSVVICSWRSLIFQRLFHMVLCLYITELVSGVRRHLIYPEILIVYKETSEHLTVFINENTLALPRVVLPEPLIRWFVCIYFHPVPLTWLVVRGLSPPVAVLATRIKERSLLFDLSSINWFIFENFQINILKVLVLNEKSHHIKFTF